MAKIPAAKAASMFEEIISWPYREGGDGSNSRREIDCSGAWVRVYKAFGKSIYHGSNAQYRYHCDATGVIGSVSVLRVGMAIFKSKPWADVDRGHRDYGKSPGNVYHVGCVVSVNPLRIVHATTPIAKADSALGNWTLWGTLSEVALDGAAPMPTDYPVRYQAEVVTQSGPLNLRSSAPSGSVIGTIPRGDIVQVLDASAPEGWNLVHFAGLTGFASAQYLQRINAPSPSEQPGVFIPCASEEKADALAAALRELAAALANTTITSAHTG